MKDKPGPHSWVMVEAAFKPGPVRKQKARLLRLALEDGTFPATSSSDLYLRVARFLL